MSVESTMGPSADQDDEAGVRTQCLEMAAALRALEVDTLAPVPSEWEALLQRAVMAVAELHGDSHPFVHRLETLADFDPTNVALARVRAGQAVVIVRTAASTPRRKREPTLQVHVGDHYETTVHGSTVGSVAIGTDASSIGHVTNCIAPRARSRLESGVAEDLPPATASSRDGVSTEGVGPRSVPPTSATSNEKWHPAPRASRTISRRLAIVAAIAFAVALVAWRLQGLPPSEWWISLRGDPQHGRSWVIRCDDYLRAGRMADADHVCARGLTANDLTPSDRARLLVGRATLAQAAGRANDAASILTDAIAASNDPDTREAVRVVCAKANVAPLEGEIARALVVASATAPVKVFVNRAFKKKTFLLDRPECVAVGAPSIAEDGSLWSRVSRDPSVAVAPSEDDERYGYVPIEALRPAPADADGAECTALANGGALDRALAACERAALSSVRADAASAAETAARVAVRSGRADRAAFWLASALRLDDGSRAAGLTRDLDGACTTLLQAIPPKGRRFMVVAWPWDEQTGTLRAAPPSDTTLRPERQLPSGTCVLADAPVRSGPEDLWFPIETMFENRATTGWLHRVVLRPD